MTTTGIAGLCERLRFKASVRSFNDAHEPLNPDGPKAADTLERQAAEIERLRGAFASFVDAIKNAPISWETGVCCCGSPVEGHGFGDGHSPVDEGSYFVSGAIKAARAALTGED